MKKVKLSRGTVEINEPQGKMRSMNVSNICTNAVETTDHHVHLGLRLGREY